MKKLRRDTEEYIVLEDTDEDHFGCHIIAVLKRLPGHARAMARLRIEQVLLDAEFPEPVHVKFLISYALYNVMHNFLDYFYVFILYLCMDQGQTYLLMKFLSCM